MISFCLGFYLLFGTGPLQILTQNRGPFGLSIILSKMAISHLFHVRRLILLSLLSSLAGNNIYKSICFFFCFFFDSLLYLIIIMLSVSIMINLRYARNIFSSLFIILTFLGHSFSLAIAQTSISKAY